jgi:uncharacterized protein with FMN-binding domain
MYYGNNMKKLLLSFSVIILFLIYSFYQKQLSSNVRISVPNPQSGTPTPAAGANGGPLDSVRRIFGGENEDDSVRQVVPPVFNSPTPLPAGSSVVIRYKDGVYTGNPADALYGNIQVKAIITNGRITDVQFLQYPSDRNTSVQINSQAMPFLKQEAILVQSAQVNIVTGATDTSQAFIQSLNSALLKAKI